MEPGTIQKSPITEELSKNYLDYAMSVIVARALPDVRDGLKPVHRRILYAMQQMGLGATAAYTKSAKVVGEVLGKYHPHSDTSVYDAMVRLAQEFSMRYPLVDGQGNFGSVDGDPPAAMRYTEARMAKITPYMLADIDKKTVDYEDNFDATLEEPVFLPAVLPNLLLMGSEGIAVGMATKIPPHNLCEVVDGVIASISAGKPVFEKEELEESVEKRIAEINKLASGEEMGIPDEELYGASQIGFETDITVDELVKHIPGPDFPTGGAIYGGNSMVEMYSTGRGKIVLRGVAEIKEGRRGKSVIEITELPYQVNKAKLVENIAHLARDKRIKGISALRDESDKRGMSVIVELKREAKPKAVLNSLYKYTKLQTSFPANFVALVNGIPHTVNLKQVLTEYVKHRQAVILRRSIFDLVASKRRAHILEGLKIALDNLDDVIKTIRGSRTQEDAKDNLMKKFGFTGVQATAILDMQLRRLAALEREKIESEYEEVKKHIDEIILLLKTPKKVLDVIVKEVAKLKQEFGDKRLTKIYKQKSAELSEEDLVAKQGTIITITKTGYIKRVPYNTYKSQRRGGKGVLGMTTKEEDEIKLLISGTTHDTILFFTDKGRVFGSKAWEIPETSRQAKGQAIVNILNIGQGEEIRTILAVNLSENESGNLILATRKGIVKKTKLSQFKNLKSGGLIAIRLKGDDKLVSARITSGSDHIFMTTKEGKAIRYSEKDVRTMGRATSGMKGVRLNESDEVIAMTVFPQKHEVPKDKRKTSFRDILTISEKGLGKRTKTALFPKQGRAGKGVKAAVVSDKTGPLAASVLVTENSAQVVITSSAGQIIKLPVKNIPQMGRSTQGVILMRFAKKADHVAALTVLEKQPES